MMNVVFDEDFAKVWSDGYTPCAFAVMYHMPEISRFKEMCEAHVTLVKHLANGCRDVYSVSNMADSQPFPLDALFLYWNIYLPKQFESGLRYKAYVRPRNLFSQFSLETVLKNIDEDKIGIFDSFEEALQAVSNKCSSTRMLLYGETVL